MHNKNVQYRVTYRSTDSLNSPNILVIVFLVRGKVILIGGTKVSLNKVLKVTLYDEYKRLSVRTKQDMTCLKPLVQKVIQLDRGLEAEISFRTRNGHGDETFEVGVYRY